MKKVLSALKNYLENELPSLDAVVRKAREDEVIPTIDKFAVSLEFGTNVPYKDRVKRKQSTFFINCFCHGDESVKADLDVMELADNVTDTLNRADFSNVDVKIYGCKFVSSTEDVEYKQQLDAFQQVVEIEVRWTTDVN